MIPGATALGVLALGEIAAADDVSTANAVRSLLADPTSDLVFVLVANPLPLDGVTTQFPYALGTHALGELAAGDMGTRTTPVYLSDHGWTTDPDEDPPSQPMPPRLAQPLNYEARIPLPGQSQGRASATVGVIQLANPDGELDAYLGYAWAGRTVDIRLGGTIAPGTANAQRLAFADFATVFRGTVSSLRADRNTITLTLRDPATRLERPAQRRTYAGTGGLEGDSDLAGRYVPLGYGPCHSCAAPYVIRSELLLQLHDGAFQAVLAAYDKGVALTFAGDYATVALLRAATQGALGSGADIEAGEYATCKAEGFARLGGEPSGLVTFDFQGDATGSYIDTAPAIVRRLATTRAVPLYADPDEIDAAAFAALATTAAVGIWVGPEGASLADMCSRLMAAIGGWWVHDRAGKLSVGVLDAPGTPVAEHATYIDGTLEETRPPAPAWRQRLGYRRYAAVQDASALADSLTAEQKAGLGEEYRYVQASSETVRTFFPDARDADDVSLIDAADAALTEAERRLRRDKRLRRLARFSISTPLFRYRLGETHRIGFDALGLEGRDGVVVAIAEDAARRRATLELWG